MAMKTMCTQSLLLTVQRADGAQVQLNLRQCFFFRSGGAGDFLVAGFLSGAGNRHLPDTDKVVTVSSKERLSIGAPCKGQALRGIGPGAARHLGPQLLDHVLALKIPDLDGGTGGCAQPVPVRAESKSIDGVSMVQGVEVLAIIEIPHFEQVGLTSSFARGVELNLFETVLHLL